jgi:hypothetical protein
MVKSMLVLLECGASSLVPRARRGAVRRHRGCTAPVRGPGPHPGVAGAQVDFPRVLLSTPAAVTMSAIARLAAVAPRAGVRAQSTAARSPASYAYNL